MPCKAVHFMMYYPKNSQTVCAWHIRHLYKYDLRKLPFHFVASFFTLSPNSDLILVDDFNIMDINWDLYTGTPSSLTSLCDKLPSLCLSQLVQVSTHQKGNILDLSLLMFVLKFRIYMLTLKSALLCLTISLLHSLLLKGLHVLVANH